MGRRDRLISCQQSCLQSKSLVVSGVVCSQRAWLSAELPAAKELQSWGRPDMLSLRLENVFCRLVFSATLVGCDGTSLNLRFLLWAFGLFCPVRSLTRTTCFSLERRWWSSCSVFGFTIALMFLKALTLLIALMFLNTLTLLIALMFLNALTLLNIMTLLTGWSLWGDSLASSSAISFSELPHRAGIHCTIYFLTFMMREPLACGTACLFVCHPTTEKHQELETATTKELILVVKYEHIYFMFTDFTRSAFFSLVRVLFSIFVFICYYYGRKNPHTQQKSKNQRHSKQKMDREVKSATREVTKMNS